MTADDQRINWEELRARLSRSFTPHRPVELPEFFAGRINLLDRAMDAVNTSGLHVVLFGDRGTGKTSIGRVLAYSVQEPDRTDGLRAIVVSCTSTDNFGSIWQKVFQEILLSQRQLGFVQDAAAPVVGRVELGEPIGDPNDVRLFVRSLPNPSVIVIDEFDRLPTAGNAARLMADTIKLFADTGVVSTIVLVGVADSIEDLVAGHQSISRNIAQLHVRPMDLGELREIVQRGFKRAGLTHQDGVADRIAKLSQGYPHYAHLLGLWGGRQAISAERTEVTGSDLDRAIPDALENAVGGAQQEYEKAVGSPRHHTLFKEVLLACALADKDSLGRFSAVNVRGPFCEIMHRDYTTGAFQSHLTKFCQSDRGPALKRTGSKRNYRWQFVNPQLIPYVLLSGVTAQLIGE